MNAKDKSKLEKLAQELVTYEIDPTLASLGELPDRWKKNYSIQRNEPGCSGQQTIAPNYKPFHVPFTQPRIDLIAGGLYQRFTSVDPMVQFIPQAKASLEDGNDLEKLVQTVFDRAGMDTSFPLGVQTAAVCGVTVFRMYPDKDKGMCISTIHPEDFVCYPSSARCVKDAMTVGHRFYMSVDEIEDKEEQGIYLEGSSDGLTGQPLQSEDLPGSPILPRQTPEEAVGLSKDLPVECWELITKRDLSELEDTEQEGVEGALYRVVVTRNVPRVLSIERLDYTRPWYFEGRLHVEWGGFYPEGSIAQNLQGMQHLYTDLHNALVAGSFSAMSPRIILSGGVMGDKMFTMGFGDIYEATGPVNVTQIPSSFNPGVLPQMIQEVDAKGDQIARVSRIAQNRQLKGRTTATEADMLNQQGDDAQMQYAAHFSTPVAEMAAFVQECAMLHPDLMAELYPEAPVSPEAAHGKYHIEVTGRVQGNLPQAQLEKLQTAFAACTAVNGVRMQSGLPPVYDDVALTDQMLETMQLPLSVEKLKLEQTGQDGNMGQQPPEMGGDMGQPGMGPGPSVPFAPQGGGGQMPPGPGPF